MAESQLVKGIQTGQSWAVCFYLKTKGRDRGYSERREITDADGNNLTVRIIGGLPDETLRLSAPLPATDAPPATDV